MSFVLVVRMKTKEGNGGARGRDRPRARRGLARRARLQGLRPVPRPRGSALAPHLRGVRDKAAFEAHGATEHFQRLALGELFPLMESRERTFYETL